QRAFDLQGGSMAEIAIEAELERRPGEPHLQSRAVTLEGRNEIREADRRIDRLIVPGKSAGRREASRDRRPSQGKLDIRQRLDQLERFVTQNDGAVLDAYLGECLRSPRDRIERSRQRLDVPRPVRAAIGIEDDRDGRMYQRDVGDLD